MKAKTVFYCTECGNETAKWAGRCPACGAWNSIVEQAAPKASAAGKGRTKALVRSKAHPIAELQTEQELRFSTGMGELDRVLGGGAVKGSLVLVGGAPGIGKSTLMLQICSQLCRFAKVLYVSGEESPHQLKMRAERLKVASGDLYVLSETCLGDVLECVSEEAPDILIVDSIQTLYNEELDSPAGSVSQVKDCTMTLMQLAKGQGITVLVIGHVNKEGSIAGPKVLEHMVDCVLYFEGDKTLPYRVLRAVKNRYGSTNEIGMFDMTGKGLEQIENPSQVMLEGRPIGISGTCVACVMEGTRPVLSEIQALVTKTAFPSPRRTASGFDYNRMYLLLAVLEKRAGFYFSNLDAYLNVVGGLRIDEPAVDLAVAMALVSSLKDAPIRDDTVVFGEIGLAGELRAVSHIEARVSEAFRLGFTRCVLPYHSVKNMDRKRFDGMELIGVRNVREAFEACV